MIEIAEDERMSKNGKRILWIAACLVAFNTLCGLVMGGYGTFECFMTDIGLAVTAGILYYMLGSGLSDGFRIPLFFIFIFTGLARTACLMCMGDSLRNNFLFLAACGILMFEILLLAVAKFIDTK